MDRFLDSANAAKRSQFKTLQSELSASRDRVQKLTQGKVSIIALDPVRL